jgi:hypothetical protein
MLVAAQSTNQTTLGRVRLVLQQIALQLAQRRGGW